MALRPAKHAIKPIANFHCRPALRRPIPSDWKSPNTRLEVQNLPPILQVPSSHRHVSEETDGYLLAHNPTQGQFRPWKFAAYLGDRYCSSFAALILERSPCSPQQRCDAAAKMVTNAVFARCAWSYRMEQDLKLPSSQEGNRSNLKLNETAFEAHIGALVLAAQEHPSIWPLLHDYMRSLFSKEVFPDLIALQRLPPHTPTVRHTADPGQANTLPILTASITHHTVKHLSKFTSEITPL